MGNIVEHNVFHNNKIKNARTDNAHCIVVWQASNNIYIYIYTYKEI